MYGSLLQDDYGTFQLVDFIDHHETWHDVDPDTIGEFTNVYDCNGEDICEGDIVEITSNISGFKKVGVAKYINGCFGVFCKGEWRDFHPFMFIMESMSDMGATLSIDYNFEVIGNVHDTPELLDKNEEEL